MLEDDGVEPAQRMPKAGSRRSRAEHFLVTVNRRGNIQRKADKIAELI